MPLLEIQTPAKRGAIRGRESRNQTLTTKLTEAEHIAVEEAARADAKTPGEWLRDVALRAVSANAAGSTEGIVLSEVVGIRLLLVNVLRSLATGQKLAPEAFDKLLDEIGGTKHKLAGKLASGGRR
jgi:hypothetical protein